MRSLGDRRATPNDLRRRLERLDSLPLRPATARFVLGELEGAESSARDLEATTPWQAVLDLDPGWVAMAARSSKSRPPLEVLAECAWWPASSHRAKEALQRLWRHALAVELATLRFAREVNDPDPARVARAGLLHSLGLWALASLDPEWLADRLDATEAAGIRRLEADACGRAASEIGRWLAERWDCEPLVVDAAWLHADLGRGLERAAAEPDRLLHIQRGFRLAERTPWAIHGLADEHETHEPRLKLLIAEVQSRTGGPFLEEDATPREERLTRSHARLQLNVASLSEGLAQRDRFLEAFAESRPGEDVETWADRAALIWCAEPGVSAACVRLTGAETGQLPDLPEREPDHVIALSDEAEPGPHIQLWVNDAAEDDRPLSLDTVPAWRAWAKLLMEWNRLEARSSAVLDVLRARAEDEERRARGATLAALAEFAAGAGHELNNPLAVIVGRAQLLMGREADPKRLRSLRAILTQAQRAHRILRDLMYVARPPEPRARFCRPDEILDSSVRDLRPEAEERGVLLSLEPSAHQARAWSDPDGLRHLADTFLRNAVEATPKGGSVRVVSEGDLSTIRWRVHDNGRGINPVEAKHLFDPFFCGRAAGRGHGLGLPRAARFLALCGGDVRWSSTPGAGSNFEIRMPLADPPKPPAATGTE